MKKEELAKMEDRELKKKYQSQKITTGLLTAIVIGLFLIVFIFKPESSTPSRVLPFAFLPMLVIQIYNDYNLYKELKSRQ